MFMWNRKAVELSLVTAASASARRMSARKACSRLFVGGLSYDTNEAALMDAFSQHGEIIKVRVICDPTTGKSKGYGFVQFFMESEATAALQRMDGQPLDGRNIRIQYAHKG
ncbi:glycine-rich RNA-binding protein 2, mitochondrial-like isoform X2 [Typha latifolia]|uniref:glycine-rich RNA-binding protein 2, mitochondrial-like isoform X2 n=1 Tax=Typha latifolia TaxID=4733 RepID=UPI003C2E466A